MRKKSMLKILALIGGLSLVFFCWIELSGGSTGPIALGLQSYTNTCAVVGITNHSVHQFNYVVMVERKMGSEWPKGLAVGTIIPQNQFGSLSPGQHTNLTVPVMVYAPPYPWRISVFCNRPAVQPNSLRFKAGML